jgi:hypothetical protein
MPENRYVKNGVPDENAIYRDAWRIVDPGAANPVAVAATLAAASSALLHEIGTDGIRKHPALRCMAGQLAMLYNVNAIGPDLEDLDRTKEVVDSLDKGQTPRNRFLGGDQEPQWIDEEGEQHG